MSHMVIGITIPGISILSCDQMKIKLSSLGRLQLGQTIEFQIAFARLQLNRQWINVSGSFSQIRHVKSKGMVIWFKVAHVKIARWITCQKNNWMFAGILIFHIHFQEIVGIKGFIS